MAFWKKLFGKTVAKQESELSCEVPQNSHSENYWEALLFAVYEFLRSDISWDIDGSLFRHPELLSEDADYLMQALEDNNSDDQNFRLRLQTYRALLTRYRIINTVAEGAILRERDLKSLDTLNAAVNKDFTRTLNDLFELPARQWASFIKQHMELLSPPIKNILRFHIEKERNDERKKKMVECQSLFTLCCQVGVDQAFAEKEKQTINSIKQSQNQLIQELYEMGLIESTEPISGVMDEFGAKPLDYPKQFEDDLMKANILEMVWKQDTQSMMPLIAIYESILEREKLGECPEFYAGIHFNLGNLYGQLPFGNIGNNLNTAIQHYEKALTFYTEENSPDDYAGILSTLGGIYAQLSRGQDKNLG